MNDARPVAGDFLNDRHADDVIREFIMLVDNLRVEGFEVEGALRYPFFIDCIHSCQYRKCSPRNLRYWLGPTSLEVDGHVAQVLLVREGRSRREEEQIGPVLGSLKKAGIAYSVVVQPMRSRWHRLLKSFATAAKWRTFFPGRDRNGTEIDQVANRVAARFCLQAKPFLQWFRLEVSRAVARYRKAAAFLETLEELPKVIVCNTEYHPLSRALLLAGRARGIRTVLVQHGFLGQEWSHWPVLSDLICVWGKVDMEWYVERGFSPERLRLTGSPRGFRVVPELRRQIRANLGVSDNEKVIVFFAPNLDLCYHDRASRFLHGSRMRCHQPHRWYVKAHPSQENSLDLSQHYGLVQALPVGMEFSDALSAADVVLHDFSTMAFADYAGVPGAVLALDPPYPKYYSRLLGRQPVFSSERELACWIAQTPNNEVLEGNIETMEAGGQEAVARIGRVICELCSSNYSIPVESACQ